MIKVVVCLHDVKAERFHDPAFVPALGAAVRGMQDAIAGNDGTDLQRHPEDFSLFELGTFDDKTGLFDSLAQPRLIVRGSDFNMKKDS